MNPLRATCLTLLLACAPASAQTPLAGIDIMTAIERASTRFMGEVIAADLTEGRDSEPAAVYSLRLLTPTGDIIEIRIDASDGTIIEVNGRGLVDARRPVQGF